MSGLSGENLCRECFRWWCLGFQVRTCVVNASVDDVWAFRWGLVSWMLLLMMSGLSGEDYLVSWMLLLMMSGLWDEDCHECFCSWCLGFQVRTWRTFVGSPSIDEVSAFRKELMSGVLLWTKSCLSGEDWCQGCFSGWYLCIQMRLVYVCHVTLSAGSVRQAQSGFSVPMYIQCVSKKNIPDIFSYNSRKHCRIFIIFSTHITEKVGSQ